MHEKKRNRNFLGVLKNGTPTGVSILNFEKLVTNGGRKIILGKVPSDYMEKKEWVQVFGKERGREREREKVEGLGPHLNKGMIFFT